MGVSASATVAARRMRLRSDFILEVADSGGETTVGGHVRVAKQTKTQLEIERLGERFLLKNAGANNLAKHRHQDFVLPCGKDFNLRDLRFLVKLFGAKLNRLARAMVLGLLQRGFEEHLPQQVGMIEILGVAVEERERGQFSLLRVQILCLLKLKQWAEVVRLGRINNHDALTLLELSDQVVAVERGQYGYGDSDEEPEPRQPVALCKQLGRIEALSCKAGRRSAVAGRGLAWSQFGGCHGGQ